MRNPKKRLIPLLSTLLLVSCSSSQLKTNRDDGGLTPLHRAAGQGDVLLMEKLIAEGGDINALDSKMGIDVLHKAVYSGNPQAVKLLLEKGALIDLQSPSNGDTPLHDAIYFKKKTHGRELIALLLKAHASLSIRNRAGLTPIESAELLKDNETIAQIKDEEKRRFSSQGRALMGAIRRNDVKRAKILLSDKSTPVEESDDQGFTPLPWAAREGMVQMVALLLDHGANPNHLDSWMGANAGHKAGFWGRTDVMRLLVKHGLDLNARGLYNGYTPLHDAVSGNHLETARVLIEAEAKTNIQGHDGKTPLDIAKENGNQDIVRLLQ